MKLHKVFTPSLRGTKSRGNPSKDHERPFLPYGQQTIDEDDIVAVTDVMRGNHLTCGPVVEAFESALAHKVDAPYAVAVSNGTVALHLTMLALDIGSHDQVIVPTMTFLASANAVKYVGGDVVFSDVDPDTGLMRWEDYQTALSAADQDKLKAILYVHLNGQVGRDFIRIAEDARARGLRVIEDAAHAIGSAYAGFQVGSCAHSDAVTFSFHPVKTMTTGEGGAVCAKDPAIAEKLKRLRHHNMVRDPDQLWKYSMSDLGFNYRLTDIQCALGLSQLNKLDQFVAKRAELVAAYDQAFQGNELIRPIGKYYPDATAWHLYVVHIDFIGLGLERGQLMKLLLSKNIGTQLHYIPVHSQPFYGGAMLDFPGAAAYFSSALSLPLFPSMTRADVDYVVAGLVACTSLRGA